MSGLEPGVRLKRPRKVRPLPALLTVAAAIAVVVAILLGFTQPWKNDNPAQMATSTTAPVASTPTPPNTLNPGAQKIAAAMAVFWQRAGVHYNCAVNVHTTLVEDLVPCPSYAANINFTRDFSHDPTVVDARDASGKTVITIRYEYGEECPSQHSRTSDCARWYDVSWDFDSSVIPFGYNMFRHSHDVGEKGYEWSGPMPLPRGNSVRVTTPYTESLVIYATDPNVSGQPLSAAVLGRNN